MLRSKYSALIALGLVAMCSVSTGCSASDTPDDVSTRRDGDGDGGSTGDGAVERCAGGVDSDRDGIPNDVECMLGSDPFNPDSDGDGVSDGAEANYPRICVAENRMAQRRPPVNCRMDSECMTGERCRGLDPTSADSDGDGVPDNMEDVGLDGRIDTSMGETDPRLWDSDGDGRSDGEGGLDICRPMGLANVTQVVTPPGAIQIGHDPAFGTARNVTGTMNRGAVLLDDAATNVSGVVISMPSTGDVRAESSMVEMVATTAMGMGVSTVLVGRSVTTHELNPAVTSTYRVARMTSASALRDSTVMALVGAPAPAGPTVGMAAEFLVDITTVRRTMGSVMNRTDVIIAVSPRADYDNNMRATAIRVNDLVNTTAVAEASRSVGFACQVLRADRIPMVDFIWTVDVSPSMGPYQVQVGNTAARFFRDLTAAGVDFRVAVLAAQPSMFNFAMPGLRWVNSGDAMGADQLAHRVTVERFMGMATDTLAPYPNNGMYTLQLNEEPIAAAIIAYEQLRAGTMMMAPVERRLRPGAQVVAFFVADETGTNDVNRYFARDTARWGTTYPTQLMRAVQFFRDNMIQTYGLVNFTPAPMCDMAAPADMRRCVIVGNGGAWIPIGRATDADVAAAMARIVSAVAGSSSQFRLTRSPITSTIRVRVRGMDVPRSRADGFDFDAASRSVVFFGSTHRPRMGDEVVISYRVWEGSLG